ncbi:hypothetical protein ZOSMA_15G01130 [Zostera marina]|uniref:Uncharacterized protein n=1 Tax=Zostera marina TaxID=29655 RepID=A0A0K9PV09_ZOSMR|nr:hypothetical protein ZOSMA_15G01130 [Zostera marina]
MRSCFPKGSARVSSSNQGCRRHPLTSGTMSTLPPWQRWTKARKITHFRPLASNTIYMPNNAINAKECLDGRSVLIRMIGITRKEEEIASFIKINWKLRHNFRLTRMNKQTFKVDFYSPIDFDRVAAIKWEHLDGNLIVVRRWKAGESIAEDPLDTVPQKAIIHNIPATMWGDEAIGRIASSLGVPLEARATDQRNQYLPPPLEVCVVIDRKFSYPTSIRIRTEGHECEPTRDVVFNVEYVINTPYCFRCAGYGHWPQQCKGRAELGGRWNEYISAEPTTPDDRTGDRAAGGNSKIQNTKSPANRGSVDVAGTVQPRFTDAYRYLRMGGKRALNP